MNQLMSLEQAEDHICQIIMRWPSIGGGREVENQRAELAGTIETMMFFGVIKETTRAVLNAIYVQGWAKKEALKQFGNIKKAKKKAPKTAQSIVDKDVVSFPKNIVE